MIPHMGWIIIPLVVILPVDRKLPNIKYCFIYNNENKSPDDFSPNDSFHLNVQLQQLNDFMLCSMHAHGNLKLHVLLNNVYLFRYFRLPYNSL